MPVPPSAPPVPDAPLPATGEQADAPTSNEQPALPETTGLVEASKGIAFTLYAQDTYAPQVVEYWANLVAGAIGKDHPKVVGAREIAKKMRQHHTRKIPD